MKDKPFLIRDSFLPGESLTSLICRVADLNHYSSHRTAFLVCQQRFKSCGILDKPAYPYSPKSYTVLANLLQADKLDIYHATLHRFASLLPPLNQTAHRILLSRQMVMPLLPGLARMAGRIRGQDITAYCPVCLQEHAYGRLSWLLSDTVVCLQHQCLLHDRCPKCAHLLSTSDLILMHCHRCQSDLVTAPIYSIQGDSFGLFAQSVMNLWLGLARAPEGDRWWSRLPQWDNYKLYQVSRQLSDQLTKHYKSLIPFLHSPGAPWLPSGLGESVSAQARRYLVLATSIRSMLDWPQGFSELLDSFPSSRMQMSPRILLGAVWRHPDFQLFGDDNNNARRTDGLDPFLEDFPSEYMPAKSTLRLLGVSAKLLVAKKLLNVDASEGRDDRRSVDKLVLVPRRGFANLVRYWNRPVELKQAAEWLGLPTWLVKDLSVELHWEHPACSKGGRLQLERGSVLNWLDNVLRKIAYDEPPRFPVDLSAAARLLRPLEENEITIVTSLTQEIFHAWAPIQAHELSGLRFGEFDLFRFAVRQSCTAEHLFDYEIAASLKVPKSTVEVWVKRGLLLGEEHFSSAYFSASTFNIRHPWLFLYHCITEMEVAERLKTDRKLIERWVKHGLLSPLSGPGQDASPVYLFRRADFEKFVEKQAASQKGWKQWQQLQRETRWELVDYENYKRLQRRKVGWW